MKKMHASGKNVCSFSIWKLKTWNGKEFRDESESQRWVDSGGILLKTPQGLSNTSGTHHQWTQFAAEF